MNYEQYTHTHKVTIPSIVGGVIHMIEMRKENKEEHTLQLSTWINHTPIHMPDNGFVLCFPISKFFGKFSAFVAKLLFCYFLKSWISFDNINKRISAVIEWAGIFAVPYIVLEYFKNANKYEPFLLQHQKKKRTKKEEKKIARIIPFDIGYYLVWSPKRGWEHANSLEYFAVEFLRLQAGKN